MATLAFYKNMETTDQSFYIRMKSEVLQLVNQMDSALRNYKGTFEFTVDMYNPRVQYSRDACEKIDERQLQAHIMTLRSKQYEIAVNFLEL